MVRASISSVFDVLPDVSSIPKIVGSVKDELRGNGRFSYLKKNSAKSDQSREVSDRGKWRSYAEVEAVIIE